MRRILIVMVTVIAAGLAGCSTVFPHPLRLPGGGDDPGVERDAGEWELPPPSPEVVRSFEDVQLALMSADDSVRELGRGMIEALASGRSIRAASGFRGARR